MQEAHSDAATFLAADVDLHLLLAEVANNRYLLKAMGGIRSMLRRDLELGAELSIRRVADLQFAVDDHPRIVEAIATRNPAGARTDIINVIGHNREFVLGMYAHVSTNATQEGISTEW